MDSTVFAKSQIGQICVFNNDATAQGSTDWSTSTVEDEVDKKLKLRFHLNLKTALGMFLTIEQFYG